MDDDNNNNKSDDDDNDDHHRQAQLEENDHKKVISILGRKKEFPFRLQEIKLMYWLKDSFKNLEMTYMNFFVIIWIHSPMIIVV
jgi:hypothetical protein